MVNDGTIRTKRITKISQTKHKGKVYDITVDNTHTYMLNGMASSNSAGGSLICYLLGIHELDPLKWGLSFTRFMSPSRGGFLLNVSID